VLNRKMGVTFRRAVLYDAEVRGITVEVIVERVSEARRAEGFPWTNTFVPETLRFFDPPIGREELRRVDGLHSFARNQSPYRNLTHQQYRELVKAGS